MAACNAIQFVLHDPRIGWYVSLVLHASLVVLLGLLTIPTTPTTQSRLIVADSYERSQELVTEVLDANLDISAPVDIDSLSSESIDIDFSAEGFDAPEVDEADLANVTDMSDVRLPDVVINTTTATELFGELPDDIAVASNEASGGSAQAVDRITDELSQVLWSRQALVVWLFDQSGSMKPDRERIRQRVDRIYTELGIRGTTRGDVLTTSVASFGGQYALHTRRPTSDLNQIRSAIDAVPIDTSGDEKMCSAVIEAIREHTPFLASRYDDAPVREPSQEVPSQDLAFERGGSSSNEKRKMVLILVTDESGDREDNFQRLEEAVKVANRADCRIYVLGRESSFGHPYDSVRWLDPKSKQAFTVKVDRGPETASLELLQTSGTGRRGDHFKSGFGPYEQSRLSRATGGIFFMLPDPTDKESVENRGKRTGNLRIYLPNLESREEYVRARNRSRLRKTIAKIIVDLDTWNTETYKKVSLPYYFSIGRNKYTKAANRSLAEARELIAYYDKALETLGDLQDDRERETDRRWQANYDLLLAQLTAYKLRSEQYVEAVGGGIRSLPPVKNALGPGKATTHWRVKNVKPLMRAKQYARQQQLASQRLQAVVDTHDGTPWALRAAYELKRTYGYVLAEHHSPPPKPKPPNPNPVAPPKL